jgi:cytochrome c oxidase assembly protein subunit 11
MAAHRRIGRTRLTATLLFGVAAGMVGLTFASAPLYRLYCQVTGFSGTPRTVDVTAPDSVSDVVVDVRFDANVNSALPWHFKPVKHQVDVRLGEEVLAFFTAENLSDRPITGTATFNVTPFKAAPYFNKIECFCFTEQTLAPGQVVEMPVVFYVDPAIADDPDAQEVRKITLSYTFFPAEADPDDDNTDKDADRVVRAKDGAESG